MADATGTWIDGGLHAEILESRVDSGTTPPVGVDVGDDEPVVDSAANGLLVAPDGAWVHEASAEFFAALGDPDPDYDAPLFAVKNLGFIGVRVSRSLVDIRLHPRSVSAVALRSVENVLSFMQADLFRITYLREEWRSETVSSTALTLWRLGEICGLEGVGITSGDANSVLH